MNLSNVLYVGHKSYTKLYHLNCKKNDNNTTIKVRSRNLLLLNHKKHS